MEIKTFQDFVNYLSVYGDKVVSCMKERDNEYRKVTYNELCTSARSFAAYLDHAKHLKKGDIVALCTENCPDWFAAYYGIVYNGIWAAPFDAKLNEREIKNLLTDCGAGIFVLSREVFESISTEPEVMAQVHEFIVINPDEKTFGAGKKVKSFASVIAEGAKYALKDHKVSPDDVASLIYTSGTTGKPKGVLLTHKNFIVQALTLIKTVPVTIDDTEISVLPLHHTFEFSVENMIMCVGGTICYAESLKSNRLFANIVECNVTLMFAVPLLYEKILDGIMRNVRSLGVPAKQIILGLMKWSGFMSKLRGNNLAGKRIFGFLRKKANLDKMKFLVSGAAPLSAHVARGMEALGFDLLNGYGITEASPVISVNRVEYPVFNESVGIALDGVEVKILDPDKNGHGEILARGDSIMKGYYKNKAVTAEVLDKEGFLHTGDIGKIEEHDGQKYIYITGRCKNIIVTPGGKNVYPEEIEEMLSESDLVLESLVLGVPVSEHSKGENIYALIVPNYEYVDSLASIQGFKNTEEHIQEMIEKHVREVNEKLKTYQKITGFRIRREEFPKTSTKKIKRFLFNGSEFMNL